MAEQNPIFDDRYVTPASTENLSATTFETATDTDVMRSTEIGVVAKRYGTGKPRRYLTKAEKPRNTEK